jgi:hypothetical protein
MAENSGTYIQCAASGLYIDPEVSRIREMQHQELRISYENQRP